MRSSNRRRNPEPRVSGGSNQPSTSANAADSQGTSDEVPVIGSPQKRSWAAIAAVSESQDHNKVPKIDTTVPVVSTPASGGPSQGSGQSGGWKQSGREGNSPTRSGSETPSRRQSQNTHAFVPFVQTRHYDKVRWPNATFVPGIIISASHYEEHYEHEHATSMSPTNVDGTQNLCPFEDPKGNKVCLKQRMMVVVHTFDDSYVAVPIYSYGTRGIQHMRPAKRLEHLDIHDHRSKPADLARQNNLPPLITREIQHWKTDHLLPRSAVYFTYPISLPYRIKVALMGELTAESTNTLLTYYYRYIPARFRQSKSQPQQATQATSLARPPIATGTTPVDPIPEAENLEG